MQVSGLLEENKRSENNRSIVCKQFCCSLKSVPLPHLPNKTLWKTFFTIYQFAAVESNPES